MDNVRALRTLKDWEEDHDDVETPEINPKDWPRTMESIEEWLRGCLGVTKIPLAYVIRDTIDPPDAGDDPVTNYTSKQDELIARAPIRTVAANGTVTYNAIYLSDRTKVWELMSELTRGKDCWTYVQPAQRSRDGRMAFHGLKGHYLGANNVDNMSSQAEKKLQSTTYTGEKRRWNFEKYVKVHVDQHAILDGLKPHGYAGIDERSKVRHLIAGIKTSNLEVVKTQILSNATLRNDFEACVNLFQDFIKQNRSEVKDFTVAGVKTNTQNDTNKSTEADMSVEDRYYNRSEYSKLTNAQKLGLKLKREKRGQKKGSQGKKSSNR